jgi:hypothetical protein
MKLIAAYATNHWPTGVFDPENSVRPQTRSLIKAQLTLRE